MTVMSTIYLLGGAYPQADTYGEIIETHHVPGGETGNSAIVLSSLGYNVKIDGPYLGKDSKDGIEYFCDKYNIDCSNMPYDDKFIGIKDVVMVGEKTRTVFGWFQQYFGNSIKRWTKPDYVAIDSAKVVGLDPYFPETSEDVARYCGKTSKPYVSIDAPYDNIISKNAAAIITSKEFINSTYPDMNTGDLMTLYTQNTDGLVIFTFGSDDILFSRKGQPISKSKTFDVTVKSTLGAGDTFRAGVIHGVYNKLLDSDIVEFASATAACVISRFPMALNPPTMKEITDLIKSRK